MAICHDSVNIFSDAKQQLIKKTIAPVSRLAPRNKKTLENQWLVDRLSWLVNEIATAVFVNDKKLDDLIEPIYDTYKSYYTNLSHNLPNLGRTSAKKNELFKTVKPTITLTLVHNLTSKHEYYQIAYLDSLTKLSRPELPQPLPQHPLLLRLPSQPPSGGGGRRTRKHRTKRRTRSEKKRPRRTRKKKNKKQRMSRKRNKSTKT